jgi:hypothetical protein
LARIEEDNQLCVNAAQRPSKPTSGFCTSLQAPLFWARATIHACHGVNRQKHIYPAMCHKSAYYPICPLEGSRRWSQVAQGGSKAAAAASERHTLFLCYPPPASSMAADCLRSFRCSPAVLWCFPQVRSCALLCTALANWSASCLSWDMDIKS